MRRITLTIFCTHPRRHLADIFLARQARQLWLEELMYHELIEIYRSPETLMKETALPPGGHWGENSRM